MDDLPCDFEKLNETETQAQKCIIPKKRRRKSNVSDSESDDEPDFEMPKRVQENNNLYSFPE